MEITCVQIINKSIKELLYTMEYYAVLRMDKIMELENI